MHFPFGVQSHVFILAFRAIVSSQSRCSEPLFLLGLGVQSRRHFSVLEFRAIISFQSWHSEPPTFFIQRSEPSPLLCFGVQSHYFFLVSAFRATISSRSRRLEPSPLLSFGVQSHYFFSVSVFRATSIFHSAFRAIITSQSWHSEPSAFSIRRSEPSPLLSFGVQSHHHFSVLAFRTISIFHSMFRAITTS